MSKYVGFSVRRLEDSRLLRGGSSFVDDIRLPGMLYARILRSPYACAKIKSIDISKAHKLPGVSCTLTGEESLLLSKPWHSVGQTMHAFALGRVKYMGEEVAAVAATEPGIAEDALDLITVEYEQLRPVVDVENALSPDAPLVNGDVEGVTSNVAYHYRLRAGDVERAFKEADLIVSERLTTGTSHCTPIETTGCVASYDGFSGKITMWVTTQNPFLMRSVIAEAFGVPENKVHVIAPDMGGAFGIKTVPYRHYLIALLLSRKSGRPVKIILDRREELMCTGRRHLNVRYPQVAVRKDGRILGWKEKVIVDVGFTLNTGALTVSKSALMIPGAYKIENVLVDAYCIYTNKAQCTSNRGFGHPQAMFARERMMDIVADKLGMDPLELRLRNVVRAEDSPYKSSCGPIFDTPNFEACVRRAAEELGWTRLRANREVGVGIGIALIQKNNGGYGVLSDENNDARAVRVQMDASGSVTVFSCSAPQGQSHETVMAQVAAEELGVSIEKVATISGDTEKCPFGQGTYSSTTPLITVGALYIACRKLKDKAKLIAAHTLTANQEDLEYEEGIFAVKGNPQRRITLMEVAKIAYKHPERLPAGVESNLAAESSYDPPGKTPFDESGCAQAASTYDIAAYAVQVKVDSETGRVTLLKCVAAHDSGMPINPMIVDGQIHGSIAHGVGLALSEDLSWNMDGQLVNPSFLDYCVPTAPDISLDSTSISVPSFCPVSPGGHRGVGESGTIGVPAAIANAVNDAIRMQANELPLSPERIYALIRKNSKRGLNQI